VLLDDVFMTCRPATEEKIASAADDKTIIVIVGDGFNRRGDIVWA
jgi:hypothetical protein